MHENRQNEKKREITERQTWRAYPSYRITTWGAHVSKT